MYCQIYFIDKNVDIKCNAHDTFLDNHSSGKLKAKIFERSLKVSNNKEALKIYVTVQRTEIIFFNKKNVKSFKGWFY